MEIDLSYNVHVQVVGAKGKPIDQVKADKTKVFLVVQVLNVDLSKENVNINKLAYCMTKRTVGENGEKETLQIDLESNLEISCTQPTYHTNLLLAQIINPRPVSDIFPEKKRGLTPAVFVEVVVNGNIYQRLAKYATSSHCINSCFHPLTGDNPLKTYVGLSCFSEGNKKRKVTDNNNQFVQSADAFLQTLSTVIPDFDEVMQEPTFQLFCSPANIQGRQNLSLFVGIPEPLLPNIKLNTSTSPYLIQLHLVKAGENLLISLQNMNKWTITKITASLEHALYPYFPKVNFDEKSSMIEIPIPALFYNPYHLQVIIEASYQAKTVLFEYKPEFPLCIIPNLLDAPLYVTTCWWEWNQTNGLMNTQFLARLASIYLKEFYKWASPIQRVILLQSEIKSLVSNEFTGTEVTEDQYKQFWMNLRSYCPTIQKYMNEWNEGYFGILSTSECQRILKSFESNNNESNLAISRLGSVRTMPVFSLIAYNEIYSVLLEEDEMEKCGVVGFLKECAAEGSRILKFDSQNNSFSILDLSSVHSQYQTSAEITRKYIRKQQAKERISGKIPQTEGKPSPLPSPNPYNSPIVQQLATPKASENSLTIPKMATPKASDNEMDELSRWLHKIDLLHLDPLLREIGVINLSLLKELKEEDLGDCSKPIPKIQQRRLFKEINILNGSK